MKVSYQGERGAYGEEAVVLLLGDTVQPIPCRDFATVFSQVSSGQSSLGVIPVENSQAGTINEVYDLLRRHDLFIQKELFLPVDHCLMALEGQSEEDIQVVYSHPQALAQCEDFIRQRGLRAEAAYDTAGSARMLKEENLLGAGAIASARAAEIYGLRILRRSIQTIKDNYTRFVLLATWPAPRGEGPQRTALVMATDHRPGALYRCLGVLARRDINLLKLESRPSRLRPWEYVFYLDFEGHREDPAVREALAELGDFTSFMKVLGSFPRAQED